jgi:hypothetical protein
MGLIQAKYCSLAFGVSSEDSGIKPYPVDGRAGNGGNRYVTARQHETQMTGNGFAQLTSEKLRFVLKLW